MRELEEILRKYFSKDTEATVYFNLDQELFNKVISNVGVMKNQIFYLYLMIKLLQ